ncbi:aldehyde-activating protein [Gammaproteobacteria bacterium 42_54_T18]|nr:aldehyde-activating protein [Gammaproteobacteria bacterium 42_54_T18]
MIYNGSCHCKAVTFQVEAPNEIDAEDCNCSICSKTGFLHLIVPKNKFTLLTGESNITTYTFNTGVAQHYFCTTCGIKPFYIPRSNPDGVDINARCLDDQPSTMHITKFDGQHWEDNAHNLARKSKPTP